MGWSKARKLGACILGLLMVAGPACAQRATAKITSVYSEGHPLFSAQTRFSQLVKERTNGEIDIRVYPNSQLGGEAEVAESMRLGSVEGALLTSSVLTGYVPEVQVFDLPFIIRDNEHAAKVYAGPVREKLGDLFAAKGYRLLSILPGGARHLFGSFEIRNIEDVKGRKMRVIQSPMHLDLWRTVGTNPTPIPAPEIYTSLQTKVVDFADNTKTNYLTFRFYEAAPYFTDLGHIYATVVFVFSDRWWQRLKPEQRAILQEAANEVTPTATKALFTEEDNALAKTVQGGAKVTVITDKEPWRKLTRPIWDAYTGKVPSAAPLVQAIIETK